MIETKNILSSVDIDHLRKVARLPEGIGDEYVEKRYKIDFVAATHLHGTPMPRSLV